MNESIVNINNTEEKEDLGMELDTKTMAKSIVEMGKAPHYVKLILEWMKSMNPYTEAAEEYRNLIADILLELFSYYKPKHTSKDIAIMAFHADVPHMLIVMKALNPYTEAAEEYRDMIIRYAKHLEEDRRNNNETV